MSDEYTVYHFCLLSGREEVKVTTKYKRKSWEDAMYCFEIDGKHMYYTPIKRLWDTFEDFLVTMSKVRSGMNKC